MVDDHEHLEHDPVYARKYTHARTKVRGIVTYSHYMSSRMIGKIPKSHRIRALDLMCGSGAMFSALGSAFQDFIGVDSSPAMLELVPDQYQKQVVLADATDLPSSIGKFNVVFIRGGLRHEPDAIAKVVAEARRVLRPAGHIVLWEPCADFMPVRKLRDRVYKKSDFFDSDHERGLYVHEIVKELDNAGFADIKIQHTGNLAYLLLFNFDVSPIARVIGSMPFSSIFSQIIIAAEQVWESIPWLNNAAFNVLVAAAVPDSDSELTEIEA